VLLAKRNAPLIGIFIAGNFLSKSITVCTFFIRCLAVLTNDSQLVTINVLPPLCTHPPVSSQLPQVSFLQVEVRDVGAFNQSPADPAKTLFSAVQSAGVKGYG
jgi:hypothetical protein